MDQLQLQNLLDAFVVPDGGRAYSNPPPKMAYPAILHSLTSEQVRHADNSPYARKRRYMVTLIYKGPEPAAREKIANLPLCSFDRAYKADELNHQIFNLYF